MKEKLKALFEKWKAKLKFPGTSDKPSRLGKSLGFFKWLVFIVVGSVCSVSIAILIWFYLQPLDKLAPKIETYLKKELLAESVSLGKIKWTFAIGYLGVGIHVDDVSIVGVPEFKDLKMGSFQLVTQPLKIFLGKFPFSLEIKDANLTLNKPVEEIQVPTESVLSSEQGTEFLNRSLKDRIRKLLDSKLAKLLRLQIDILNLSILGEETDNIVNIKTGKIVVSGFPGTFSFECQLGSDWSQNRWTFNGDSHLSFTGFFQMWEGNLVGIKIEKINLDLEDILIQHNWGFQKPAGMRFWLFSNMQLIVDNNLDLSSAELANGAFVIDEIQTEFSGSFKNISDYSFHWFAAPREMEELELPIVGVSDIPLKGIFELNANAKMTPKNGFDAIWKMNFNNFRVDTSKLRRFVDPESYGEIRFSLVNEIELKDNTIRMPRAEFQMTGTQSQIELADHKFIKPKGDALDVLIKAGTKDDTLYLDHINILANNLSLDGKAEVQGFSDFIMKATPGKLKADVLTNSVDLTPWSPYFPVFRKVPLEGTAQFSGSADGPIYSDENPFREVSWRIDRLSASKIRGSIDRDAFQHFGIKKPKTTFSGPFSIDFLLQGRGYGDNIHRGTFLSHVDLSKMGIVYKEQIRKPSGVPLLLDFSLEKSQNRLIVRRGQLKAHEADLVLSGQLAQGSHRSELDFKIQKPIHLENWRDFFATFPKDLPLSGEVKWNGKISFDGQEAMEGNVDLSQLSLEGTGEAKNLNFWIPELSKPIENGFGKILFQKDGIYVPEIGFKSGDTVVKGSGSALFKTVKKAQGTIARYLGSDPMNINSQISIENLDENYFSKNIVGGIEKQNSQTKDNPASSNFNAEDALFDFRSILASPRKSESTVKVAVSANVSKKSRIKATQLGSLMSWNQGVFTADPLHFLMWGGEFKGSVIVDTRKYMERKEKPTWNINGELKNFDFEPLLRVLRSSHAGSLGGDYTGQIQWVGEGLDSDELSETLRGRIKGKVNNGYMSYLDILRAEMRTLVQNSASSDYFLDTVDVEKCFPTKMNADLDAQLRDGVLVLEESVLNFDGGTQIDLKGTLDQQEMDLGGNFLAGGLCYNSKIKSCYLKNFSKIPFKVAGPVSNLSAGMNPVAIGKTLADCLDAEIGRQTILNKTTDDQQKAKNESLADRWKKLFRGSK